jgi:hypothetical protein
MTRDPRQPRPDFVDDPRLLERGMREPPLYGFDKARRGVLVRLPPDVIDLPPREPRRSRLDRYPTTGENIAIVLVLSVLLLAGVLWL